ALQRKSHRREPAFCEATKKIGKDLPPCIRKKFMVRYNLWGLLVPLHDFLFNYKYIFVFVDKILRCRRSNSKITSI
ncbi:MAG: hypothetical protein QNJ74_07935, partial [Trichodesmium sp. MO_231.B1]|nr:hypothetical protein [Trichodesmium sp. MO_231.B1]